MAELGKAYIEVRADLAKFPAELRKKLAAALKAGLEGVEFKGLGDKAEAAGEEAARRAGEGFTAKSKESFRKAGEESGKGLLGGLASVFRRDKSGGGGFFSSVTDLFGQAAKAGMDQLSNAMSGISSIGSSVGSGLSGIGGQAGSVAMAGAMAVLIPVAIGLAGALVQLSGALFALPAAAGVGLAAIAPLIIAFQGFGEAVGAGLSGDTEAFNEALKGLPKSMQSVVKEFVAFGPILKSIKATVQENFFAPLVGAVKPLATTLLPELRKGLGLSAGAMGRLVASVVDLLGSNDIVETFGDVFETTARIVDRMSPSLTNLFGVLFGVMEKGLPFVERFFDSVADGIDTAVAWLSKIQQDGRLERWLEGAAEAGSALWDVIKTVGEYLLTMLGSFGGEGVGFLEDFADQVQELIDWLNTPEGSKYLENLGVVISAAGEVLNWLIGVIALMLPGISNFITALRELDDIFGAIGAGAVALGKAIWGFLKSAGSAIADFFTNTIPEAFASAWEWISGLPERIGGAAGDLREAFAQWLVETWKSVVDEFFKNVGRIVGLIFAFPQLVEQAWNALPGIMAAAWDAAWAWVTESIATGWAAITNFFTNTVPEAFESWRATIVESVSSAWSEAIDTVWSLVTNGFNRLMTFVSELPGKVAALGPRLYQAAVGLGESIGRGLANIGSFASDIGKKIVGFIKSGINSVIGSINTGIADIQDSLPGVTLPRIPKLARGAVINSPTLAMVGEAGREVVLPLTDPARARQLAAESGLFEVLGRGGGQQAPVINLTAILDGFGVLRVIDMRIEETLDAQGTQLGYGVRTNS